MKRLLLAPVVTGLVSLGGVVGSAVAAESPPPLAIDLTTNAAEMASGDEAGYEIVVANRAAQRDADITVELSAPADSAIADAGEAAVEGPVASWEVTVPAGADATLDATVRAGGVSDGVNGYTVRACAYADSATPLVCSTEITQVAGADSIHSTDDGVPAWLWLSVGTGLVAGVGVFAWRVHRRQQRSPAVT